MKQVNIKLSTKISYILILLFVVLVGCDEKEVLPEITFLSDKNVVFSAKDTETEKTLKFNSTKEWKLGTIEADWFDVTPKQGMAGEAVLNIRLNNPSVALDRRADVKIISENINATFTVIQEAIPVESVKIIFPPSSINKGETAKLYFEVTPSNATITDVSWSSSDEKIMKVDQEGNIEALAYGSATIKIKVNDKTDECTIDVAIPENVFTFKKLSEIENSGVTFEDGAYVVSSNFEITENNILLLEDDITVKIKDKLEIKVSGTIEFSPEDKATIMGYDDNSHPKSIYLTGNNAGGNIKNVIFIDVPLRISAGQAVVIDNCEFKYIRSKRAALDLSSSFDLKVTNCKFIENDYPAIACGAKDAVPLLFSNNYIYKNSLAARNRPQINVTVAGDGLIEITKNEVIGPAEITTNGGIAVNNMLGISGTNKVIVSENKVKDNRYGITTNGVLDIIISKNELVDNKYESNPMNGGSAISIYNSKGGQKAVISENTMKGHLWGITIR